MTLLDTVGKAVLGRPFFANQKKPSTHLNFFQNYNNHLNSVGREAVRKLVAEMTAEESDAVSFIMKETFARIYILDALRDGYDYFDEVVGATALPFLGECAAIGLGMYSAIECSHAMAIAVGFCNDDHKNHGSNAVLALMLAGAALTLSLVIFLKSAISLVTRPIVTAVQGYKPQDIDRFYDEDVASRNSAATGGLSSVLEVMGFSL